LYIFYTKKTRRCQELILIKTMKKFKLKSTFKPIKEQEEAINALVKNYKNKANYQVLLGVTGSGKTFTVANVIEKLQIPTLIISHNKTLAAQLYQEFKSFFPENAVNYFVSYYDYYQPEAYIPSTDTYIEKDAGINELIDKLRLATTTNLLTRKDSIVVASVSCIYNIGSPKEYGNFVFEFSKGMPIERKQVIGRLVDLQYERGDFGFHRGTFRVRGNVIDIYPAYVDEGIRIEIGPKYIENISFINPVSGKEIKKDSYDPNNYVLYPAKHYITDPSKNKDVFVQIRDDLKTQIKKFNKQKKLLEANRLKRRVNYDLEMIQEVGYVKGIENYSRYFDGRKPGEAPYTLLDYFNHPYGKDWLVIIDESHITFPQIRGMYHGDLSRKETLIDYGFRLPAAIDNRPLMFDEFLRRIPNFIATSATPADWEISMAKESAKKDRIQTGVVEQLLRPTGIPDPNVSIRPVENEVSDVISEIKKRAKIKQRTLVTTLTKRTAEDLSQFLKEQGIKVHYLHSDVKTLERTDILDDLRKGKYDCIVGVNLLREGLDLPEVSLVAILDADKEGFLRSEVSLIQTMGRAARHVKGEVILYADKVTNSMQKALKEVERRRRYQIKMNKKYGIKPKSIKKPFREKLIEYELEDKFSDLGGLGKFSSKTLPEIDTDSLTPMDKKRLSARLRREMKIAAQDLNFELAAEIRDKLKEINPNF
jgi:excinuclease ABC subunit B